MRQKAGKADLGACGVSPGDGEQKKKKKAGETGRNSRKRQTTDGRRPPGIS